MKKVFCVILIFSMIFVFVACGNHNIGFGNYSYEGIHCADSCGNIRDLTIISWRDDDMGIEVNTKECGSLFLSEGTYTLYEHIGECPFCNK